MHKNPFVEHPTEAALERFLLNQSSESELEAVETHFLACDRCVTRLEQLELQITAISTALRELHQEKTAKSYAKHQAKQRGWLALPGLSVAAALAMIALIFGGPNVAVHSGKSSVMNVELTAYRSFESPVLAKGHALHVNLNATGLVGELACITLVDSNGHEIWRTTATARNHTLSINVPKLDAGGAYFFRLYAAGQMADPIREFAVDVQ